VKRRIPYSGLALTANRLQRWDVLAAENAAQAERSSSSVASHQQGLSNRNIRRRRSRIHCLGGGSLVSLRRRTLARRVRPGWVVGRSRPWCGKAWPRPAWSPALRAPAAVWLLPGPPSQRCAWPQLAHYRTAREYRPDDVPREAWGRPQRKAQKASCVGWPRRQADAFGLRTEDSQTDLPIKTFFEQSSPWPIQGVQ